MRHAARVDSSQAEIVDALRQAGAYVWLMKLPTDLLVGFKGKTLIVECKRMVGKKAPKPARYTELQKDFMANWTGGIVATICDAEGALRLLKTVEKTC